MESEEFSPYASFLEYSEEIFLHLGGIQSIIIAGFISVICTIMKLIDFYHPFIPNPFGSEWYLLGFLFYLIWIGMTGILVYNGYNIYPFLRSWGQKFFRTYYFMKFQLFPAEGETPQEQLFNKIFSTFIDYVEPLTEYDYNELLALFTNVEIKGKKEHHFFDVFISRTILDKKIKLHKRILEEFFKEEAVGYLIGKFFDKEEPITSKELDNLRNEIIDAIGLSFWRSTKEHPFRIIVVSKSSFADDALEYVEKTQNWIDKKSFDLIVQRNDVYDIVWIN